jgi:drug/metabolite transporter (DMT)-like permease
VYSNTVPLVALAVAWVALGETPTWLQAGGTLLLLTGILLVRIRSGPAISPERETPPAE